MQDPFFRAIMAALGEALDPNVFEECVGFSGAASAFTAMKSGRAPRARIVSSATVLRPDTRAV